MKVIRTAIFALSLLIISSITHGCRASPQDCPPNTNITSQGSQAPELTHLYFAYGSNLSYDFLKERLKNGDWLPDGWHKSGVLVGPVPVDLGTYILEGYEFGYTLDVGTETAGNIVSKDGSRVYGVLYKLTDDQLAELDRTEDVPRDYTRVAVTVHRVALTALNKDVPQATAWVYVGSPHLVTLLVKTDPDYVYLLVRSATDRGFPEAYIDSYLKTEEMKSNPSVLVPEASTK